MPNSAPKERFRFAASRIKKYKIVEVIVIVIGRRLTDLAISLI